jgi:hypothetical protein
MSAGTFSPDVTYTTSPLTNFYADICVILPSRSTFEADGNIFLNPSISASDLAVCIYVIVPVSRMTRIRIMPRYKFGWLAAG